MAVSQTFKNAVATGDLLEVRLLMTNELLIDPSLRGFKDMEKEVRGLSGLYVPFDGEPLDENEGHWDEHYLALQQARLVSNFCQERINHVHAIILKLHPLKADSSISDNGAKVKQRSGRAGDSRSRAAGPSDHQRQKQADMASGRLIKIVGGGVVGAVVGGIVASSLEIGILVGAAAGCLGGYMLDQKRR